MAKRWGGCIAGLCKVEWANVRQPENVLRWFGRASGNVRERVGPGAMGVNVFSGCLDGMAIAGFFAHI